MSVIDSTRIQRFLHHAKATFLAEELQHNHQMMEELLNWCLIPDEERVKKVGLFQGYYAQLIETASALHLDPLAYCASQLANGIVSLHQHTQLSQQVIILAYGLTTIRTELKRAEEELHREVKDEQQDPRAESIIDARTGLYRWSYFSIRFAEEQERYRRSGLSFSIVKIKITPLADIAAKEGTLVHNMLLQQVGEQLQAQLREIDQIYRASDDTFYILLPITNDENAFKAMERVRKRFSYIQFDRPNGGEPVKLTLSVGIVMVQATEQQQAELIAWADIALERALHMENNQSYIYLPDQQAISKYQRKKVLIVEDVEMIGEMVREHLASLDYDVEVVKDGEEAYWKALVFHPHLIILDLVLPKMDGFQLLEKLRAVSEMKRVKVIIISSSHKEEDISRAFKLGIRDFIMKPFSMDLIQERVKRLL
ncbi:GGDEF domain-containing response regulator [Rubeoparvulum massiliense]|uniref:GGDEF domain-containing response regulator n=1 Tax=Rubeoparvulum massiliense TaxID=1631346 RepID=UPI00065E70BF|nr:response regulator [Rubeoparvulum massiliense]